MKQGIISDSTKSAKNLAQQIAKQIAREPLEILKTAKKQAVGEQLSNRQEIGPLDTLDKPKSRAEDQAKQIQAQNDLNDKLRSTRLVEALNREISDIQKQDMFSDLQRKISEGEEVPLEDFAELSFEQRDVLKAQMEAMKAQKGNAPVSEAPLFGSSKPSRRFGQKQAAEKEQTRVEKPVPPSG